MKLFFIIWQKLFSDYYIELMGGIPKPSPDNPFKKMVVVISSHPSITDGEVIGNNISILIQEILINCPKQFQGSFLLTKSSTYGMANLLGRTVKTQNGSRKVSQIIIP